MKNPVFISTWSASRTHTPRFAFLPNFDVHPCESAIAALDERDVAAPHTAAIADEQLRTVVVAEGSCRPELRFGCRMRLSMGALGSRSAREHDRHHDAVVGA